MIDEAIKVKLTECYDKIKDMEPEQLAEFFAENDIKGRMSDATSCPVRNFLSQCSGVENLSVGTGDVCLTMKRKCNCGDNDCALMLSYREHIIALTAHTSEFVKRFDSGQFSSLRSI